jgi:glycosyltransferase involved in cell wall biosynthesis
MVEITEHTLTRDIDPNVVIEKHFAVFQQLLGFAEESLREGKCDESAAYAQVAAHYAWFHPTGLLACPELEAILTQIGAALAPAASVPARTPRLPPRNVLHVLTEVYHIGGHTRFVWRWIRADAGRSHSVVLTRQDDGEVPKALRVAAEETGGKIHFLDRQRGGLMARAETLRRLAFGADHIVLHTYPWDVVPLMALAWTRGRPPSTLMNKDDHVFWLGVRAADQIAQMRESGRRLSQRRRGVPESRCPVLPIPLEVKPRRRTRTEAKRQLGLPAEAVVLLSVATPYKYSARGKDHFANVLLPVLQQHANAVLLVVGPQERDEWAFASQQADGRMKLFGKLGDVEPFYEGADVYLDSFPFSSLTSFLEAGSYGTPIVSYCAYPAEAATICADDPALGGLLVRAFSQDEYRSQVSRLVEDAEFRTKLGELTREAIITSHAGGSWIRSLEELYLRGGEAHRSELCDGWDVHRAVTQLDIQVARVYATCGLSPSLRQVVRNHLGLFPLRARLAIWRKMLGSQWGSLPACLVADWQKTQLRLLWRHAD